MIIRDLGVRHARKALTTPLRQTWLRTVSNRHIDRQPDSNSLLRDALRETVEISGADIQEVAETESDFSVGRKVVARPSQPSISTSTAGEYQAARRFKRKTNNIGSVVEQRYHPADVFRNPPGPQDVTLELLMSSQAHMGHNTSLWNPANSRYIFGARQGIHIISLEQTAAYLRRAARVTEEVAYAGGLLLIAGTRPGQMEIVTHAAKLAQACHLFTKWTPGTITNSDQLLRDAPVKMMDQHDKEVQGYDEYIPKSRPLVPDLVICLNPLENAVLLRECAQANIPTIGIIDTDADPTWVTYQIPANDDSLRCVAVLASVLGKAAQNGQRRRLADAKAGKVTWQTPHDVVKFLTKKYKEQAIKS